MAKTTLSTLVMEMKLENSQLKAELKNVQKALRSTTDSMKANARDLSTGWKSVETQVSHSFKVLTDNQKAAQHASTASINAMKSSVVGLAGQFKAVEAQILTSTRGMTSSIVAFQGILIALGAAKLFEFAKEAVHAYATWEQSVNRLNSVLASTNRYSAENARVLIENARKISAETTHSVHSIVEATAKLAGLGGKNLNVTELKNAQKAIVALADAMGTDVEHAAIAMGTALVTNTKALKRMGIVVDDNADSHQKLAEIMEQLNDKYLVSVDLSKSLEGKQEQLKNAYTEFMETLGDVAVEATGFEDIIGPDGLTGAFHGLSKALDKNRDYIVQVARTFKSEADIIYNSGRAVIFGVGIASEAVMGAIFKAAEKAIDALNWLTDNARKSINAVIEMANKVPGVNIGMVNPVGTGWLKSVAGGLLQGAQDDLFRMVKGFHITDIMAPVKKVTHASKNNTDANTDEPAGGMGGGRHGGHGGSGEKMPWWGSFGSSVKPGKLMEEFKDSLPKELEKGLTNVNQKLKEFQSIVDSLRGPNQKLFDDFDKINKAIEESFSPDKPELFQKNFDKLVADIPDDLLGKLVPGYQAFINDEKTWNTVLERRSDLLKEIKGPAEEYAQTLEDLNTLMQEGSITQQEYNKKLKEVKEQFAKSGKDSLQDLKNYMMSVGTKFEDTFIEAARTGKFAFKDFVGSAMEDLARLILRLMVIKPIVEGLSNSFSSSNSQSGGGGFWKSLFSIGSSLLGSAVGGSVSSGGGSLAGFNTSLGYTGDLGFASGGWAPANRPITVGERGPELISLSRPAYVTPNHELSSGGSPVMQFYFNVNAIDTKDFRDRIAQEAPMIGRMAVKATQQAYNRRGKPGPMDGR